MPHRARSRAVPAARRTSLRCVEARARPTPTVAHSSRSQRGPLHLAADRPRREDRRRVRRPRCRACRRRWRPCSDSATTSCVICRRDAPSARRTPISRVRWLTETSVVFVITTMAASRAITEIGMAAAPMRWVRRNTKSRAASGDSRSKLSGSPGRQLASRAQAGDRVVLGVGRGDVLGGAAEHLQRRRRAVEPLEGLQRHPHVTVLRGAARRAQSPLDTNHLEAAAGDAHARAHRVLARGTGVSATSAPMTATCAARVCSSSRKKRPAVMPRSRISGNLDARAGDGGVVVAAAASGHLAVALRRRRVEHLVSGVAARGIARRPA